MSRREFLYDIKFWEARRIYRGYRRRNILQYQLLRMNMWASMFCMGNPEHKLPTDIVKLYFDDDDRDEIPEMSEEEKIQLQADMDAWQAIMREKAETLQ